MKSETVDTKAWSNALRDVLLGVLVSNLAACLCLFFGIYLVSVLLLSRIPVPGITNQPADVREVGMDLQSLKHIIFEGKLWNPPPSPPLSE